MSMLENAKSNRHRKTHQVEPGGTGPKRIFMHLTRGDLRRESGGEVSRGRSSEEARRKAGGAKGRRTTERAKPKTGVTGESCPKRRGVATAAAPLANVGQAEWIAGEHGDGKGSAKEAERKCSMSDYGAVVTENMRAAIWR